MLGKPAEPFAGSGDSIDMFLVTKSLAVPEGQRVVSDLGVREITIPQPTLLLF